MLRLVRSVCMVLMLCALSTATTQAQVGSADCGDLANPEHGPFDYRTAAAAERELVEGTHFTPTIESRLERRNLVPTGADIDYTLRAFPNHPRALIAMIKLSEKERIDKPLGARYSVSCYFDRALRFRSDDAEVRMAYGIFLLKKGDRTASVEQFKVAQQIGGESANLHYNLGLAYFDLSDYTKSLEHAHSAYRLGFPLLGLRRKLEAAKAWKDPPLATSAAEIVPSDSSVPDTGKK